MKFHSSVFIENWLIFSSLSRSNARHFIGTIPEESEGTWYKESGLSMDGVVRTNKLKKNLHIPFNGAGHLTGSESILNILWSIASPGICSQ